MPEKHRRYSLKEKEAKALLAKASERLGLDLTQFSKSKASFEVVESDSGEVFLINGKPFLFKAGDDVFPTLVFDQFLDSAPRVVVDMGAIPYVCKGANVMAPGIRRFDGSFRKDSLVVIVDERHGKALSIGEILYDPEEAKNVKQGPVVRNIHFVSDKIWNLIKTL
jgi:PUA domain protein